MGGKKFTIFTGFYNYLDNLETLYKSIKNQTYKNWEWLVCDDFSENPDVLVALKKLEGEDNRIRLIYPKWKKQYYWNLPISESSGDFILVQDSDDRMHRKLLECYLYHFEKFPELTIIGASSILRADISEGGIIGAKLVNYKGSSNFIEALELKVDSISGDARAYRKSAIEKRGDLARENEHLYSMADDILKMTSYEEYGKFVCLPRVLHDYTFRPGSVSGPMWEFSGISKDLVKKGDLSIIENAKSRRSRKNMDTIFDYYDGSFDSFYQFYYSNLSEIVYRARVEYHNKNLTARKRNKISELYYDHDIFFEEKIPNPSHIIFSISDQNDIDAMKKRVGSIDSPLEQVLIYLSDERMKDHLESEMYSCGIPGWYFIMYGGVNYIIDGKGLAKNTINNE